MNAILNLCKKGVLPLLFLLFLIPVQAQVYVFEEGFVPTDINANGTVVVGENINDPGYLIWDAIGGPSTIAMHVLSSSQPSINADGSRVAGTIWNPDQNWYEMGLYNARTGSWEYLGSYGVTPPVPGGMPIASVATDISANGMVVVGFAYVSNCPERHAVSWNAIHKLIDLSNPGECSVATSVNWDGSLIGGYFECLQEPPETDILEGAIWDNGTSQLITYPDGEPTDIVLAVSSNEAWFGGRGRFPDHNSAWKWHPGCGMMEFDPGTTGIAYTTAISADGNTAVGIYDTSFGKSAFIHSNQLGFRDLRDYLLSQGFDLNGMPAQWLDSPVGILMSDDGSTLIGMDSDQKAFMLRVEGNQINNNCVAAIALECGETYFGSTLNASDSGGGEANDVYYAYTGNGIPEEVTLSLCNAGTNYDSMIRVFSDCSLTDQIAMDDNACGLQSEVTFESDGVSTYYIMVEGAGTAAGDYNLEVGCEEILATAQNGLDALKWYPNPVVEELYFQAPAPISRAEVVGLNGQLLRQLEPGAKEFNIDFANLPAGMYFVSLEMNNRLRTIKVVKQYR